MRKNSIIITIALLLLVIVSCKTNYKLSDKPFTLIETPTSQERGKNLAYNICADCHYDKTAQKFIGMKFMALPPIAGQVYAANITNSTRYGVTKGYSNAELAYLLKTGITRDGRFIPYMLRPNMAEDDVNDLIVYLRSTDRAVAPGDTSEGHTKLNFIGRIATKKIAKPQPYIENIKRPAKDDAVANGRYLVAMVGCYHCHSKSILKLNYTEPEQTKGYLQGGMKMKGDKGIKLRPSNLTPDIATGIGKYTEADFRKAIVDGKALDGRTLEEPMPKFVHLTDKQIADIYTYLKSIPPMHHKVEHHQ